ncbi:hypothetical protein [Coleofasciculus sp. FACHB-1120]|uniref:hypothetical protein n=1 Tax=Coleofasciculus sp. FACHB-1120 TaxID=2692783 RepID=UPI001688FFF6|nr:hypothetical protein [Coleofasciculus sp. FACHB-1120]MBD2742893.1 hypothetical protein [Coleofasciculus sp. FACHB-1120]
MRQQRVAGFLYEDNKDRVTRQWVPSSFGWYTAKSLLFSLIIFESVNEHPILVMPT